MRVATHVNDALRRVEMNQHGHVITMEKSFMATAADVWDACTSPDRLASWFEPVEGDLRLGGRYRLKDSGTEGSIEHCEPPGRLRVTWEYDGDSSQVDVTITQPEPGRARLVLVHRGHDDGTWRTYGPAARGVGWDSSLLALGFRLRDDPRADPERMVAWSTSPSGRAFVAASASDWGRAHLEAGADPAAAALAARRAVEFYTDGS